MAGEHLVAERERASDGCVLLVTATQAEMAMTLGRAGSASATRAGQGQAMVRCVTGMGGERARRRVAAELERQAVALVVHFGFAGGLDPGLEEGRLLSLGRVRNEAGDTIELNAGGGQTLVSVGEAAGSVEAKRKLRERTGAAAVDMESYAVAALLRERGVRFAMVRAISDPAGVGLPRGAERWVSEAGESRLRPVLADLLRDPRRLGELLRLRRGCVKAAASLGPAVRRCLESGVKASAAEATPGVVESVG